MEENFYLFSREGLRALPKLNTKQNAALVATLTLISSMLGFGRESFIAYMFGSTKFTDAYYVAFVVPDIVAGWLGYTITNALIPTLKQELSSPNKGKYKELINSVFFIILIGSTILACLTYFLKNEIIAILAPNFDGITSDIAVSLLAIMVIAIPFSALSGLLGGINNSMESFAYPALVGIFFNVFFLITLISLQMWFGLSALAFGFLAGVFGRFIIQVVPLVKNKHLTLNSFKWHPALNVIFIAMIPIFFSQAISQVNQIVDRILASGLPAGHLSNLNYASKLGLLPIGIVGTSLATPLYVRFIKNSLNNNTEDQIQLFRRSISWVLFMALIVGSGLFFFSDSLVSIFYFRGEFMLADVYLTSKLLKIYGLFTFFYMCFPIVTTYFFSIKKGKIVLVSSIISVITNIALGIILINPLGAHGLVIANGAAQVINVILLFTMIIRSLEKNVLIEIIKIFKTGVPAGALFLLISYLVSSVWNITPADNKFIIFIRGTICLISGVLTMFIVSKLFPKNDIHKVINNIFNKFISNLRFFRRKGKFDES